MVNFGEILRFYSGKRIFVTGHTGFKGSWLCHLLKKGGAEVYGYALEAPTAPSLFTIADIKNGMHSIIGDVRDYSAMAAAFQEADPEVVLHLAAQPIVKTGYQLPRETYDINVMGTVNLLECCRKFGHVRSILNITTDKVYTNREWDWGYREIDPLDGYDPYSNSKSCSELVTHSYKQSFFDAAKIGVSTARAGNVIGGGDFADNRIIPDCIRAMESKQVIGVRNPYSTRPYQHVLEPLFAYLMIAKAQYDDYSIADAYNVGPDECDCVTTGQLVDLFCSCWGNDARWENQAEVNAPHEANFLKLDCSRIKRQFGWTPRWHIQDAVAATCHWSKAWLSGDDVLTEMDREITAYMAQG